MHAVVIALKIPIACASNFRQINLTGNINLEDISLGLTHNSKLWGEIQYVKENKAVVKLHNSRTNRVVKVLNFKTISGIDITLSPDGSMMAVNRGGQGRGGIDVLDSMSGRQLNSDLIDCLPETPVAFNSKYRVMAVDLGQGLINLISTRSFKVLRALDARSGGVAASSIVFSPDGNYLISEASDRTMRIWSVETGDLLATLMVFDNDDWLAVSPSGLFDGSPQGWKKGLWRFSQNTFNSFPIEAFFRDFYRPGLLADIFSGNPLPQLKISEKDLRLPTLSLSLDDGAQPAINGKRQSVRLKIIAEEGKTDGAQDQGGGVFDVRLLRNGSLVKLWPGKQTLNGGKIELEAEISLAEGSNIFTSYAFNQDNVKSEDSPVISVQGMTVTPQHGTLFIVAIGINDYENSAFNLKYAEPDARELSVAIESAQKDVGTFSHTEIIELLNNNATKQNILLALSRFQRGSTGALPPSAPPDMKKIRPAEPEDAVVIFYAGHGLVWPLQPEKQQQQVFYLIPYNIGYQGPRNKDQMTAQIQTILSHSISDKDLEDAVVGIDTEHVMMIVDACNSGQLLEAEDARQGPMNVKGLSQLAYEKGMYVLAAAQSYQAAVATKRLGHGYLTYALEEALIKGYADRTPIDLKINVREWFDYAATRVPKLDVNNRSRLKRERRNLVHERRTDQDVQRPRAFYRRYLESEPWIIGKVKPERKL